MSGKDSTAPAGEANEEVLKAIAAFEEILEAIPEDPASLEALGHAYEQVGNRPKAAEFMARLAVVLARSGETEWAGSLLPRLSGYRDDFPSVPEAVALLERMVSAGEKPKHAEKPVSEVSVSHTFSMPDALAFAWRLLEAKEITDAEYAKVVQDLSEMSVSVGAATTSVLHVLQHSGFKGLDRILNFTAADCGTPVISLSCYDIPSDVLKLLPATFIVGRGVLPFALLGGKDVLVAVMNPYDRSTNGDVRALCGMNCHCFLTLPAEFDASVSKLVGGGDSNPKKSAGQKK